ncbi:MAG: hypothetical protein KGQ51_00990 [Planctomycetes bacterium]|jgi:hypothetical protein|nr:hypothetical protein [Planctomycetota bacterium]
MPIQINRPVISWIACRQLMWLLIISAVATTGCTRLMTLGALLVYGTELPPDFKELQGKRVAVAVATPSGIQNDASSAILSRQLSALMAMNVKKISMVDMQEVDQVAKDFPMGSFDMVKLGERLDAQYLVAVELSDLQLHDGPTLYKGRCKCIVSVYKIGDGEPLVFTKDHSNFTAPASGISKMAMDEAKFQGIYLGLLAKFIAMSFHPHERGADIAIDAAFHSL